MPLFGCLFEVQIKVLGTILKQCYVYLSSVVNVISFAHLSMNHLLTFVWPTKFPLGMLTRMHVRMRPSMIKTWKQPLDCGIVTLSYFLVLHNDYETSGRSFITCGPSMGYNVVLERMFLEV